jgi:tRNA pseudouridine55 synthase
VNRNRRPARFHGVLNICKPAGLTSHDVVDRIRRVARMKQVGHTGTLDPMATGVLPLCLGNATKIVQFLISQDKEYLVEMKLGVITDSQDSTGVVLEELPYPQLEREDIEKVFRKFEGEQYQIPPMISAKHHQGQRLYELARKGIEIEREPCKIFIHELELEGISLPCIRFRVTCSKGTYIRTLCHDLGKALKSGAVMSGLTRTRAGSFPIDQAVPLESLQTQGDIENHLCDMNHALSSLPAVTVGSEGKACLNCGRSLAGGVITRRSGEFDSGAMVRVTTRDGNLIGVGRALMNSKSLDALAGNLGVIQPVKVFQQ